MFSKNIKSLQYVMLNLFQHPFYIRSRNKFGMTGKSKLAMRGFSMVELMIMLLIASLIVAASVPIITKKHLHLPTAVNHGTYMCYYQNGHLMEARKSGRIKQKMLAGYPRETTQCVFDPPAKASLFQIIAIGGGGGGGDAGYTGEASVAYNTEPADLPPFGENSNGLTTAELKKIGVLETVAALNEVKNYLGHLWAFAEGADTGRTGTLYYTKVTTGTEVHDCPPDKIIYSPETRTMTAPTTFTLCAGKTGEKTVNAVAYGCYKDGVKVGAYITFNGESAECAEDVYDCIYPNPRYYTCAVPKIEIIEHPAEYNYGAEYQVHEFVDVPSGTPCTYLNQKNCDNGIRRITRWVTKPCDGSSESMTHHECITPAHREEKEITVQGQCEYPCTDQKIGEKNVTEYAPADTSWGTISGPGVTCRPEAYDGTVEYQALVPTGCELTQQELTTDTITYEKGSNVDSYTKGYGPFCTTPSIEGDLGLSYSVDHNDVPPSNASNGQDINKALSAFSPHSFCNDLGSCGTSFGYDHNGNYAQVSIGSDPNNSIKANSAPKGPTGNSLRRTSIDLEIYNSMSNTAINTITQTFYYDELLINGSNGTNGTCEPVGNLRYYRGSSSSSDWDCRKGGGQLFARVGYCLQHHNTNQPDAEENGNYKWHATYESKSLTKGDKGIAGEFKTIVVRSLNDIDRTIRVGRGGSAATLNLGQSGSNGSDTSFGNILIAKGGVGGRGSQPAHEADGDTLQGTLPRFNKAEMDYVKLKACLTGGTVAQADQAQCNQWKANPDQIPFYRNTSGLEGDVPHQSFLGGMFSFLFKSIGLSNGNDVAQDLLQSAGKGGTGGGVQHFCWAGRYILYFEGQELYKSSIYNEADAPAGAVNNNKIPAACLNAYENVSASPGYDGALIITW